MSIKYAQPLDDENYKAIIISIMFYTRVYGILVCKLSFAIDKTGFVVDIERSVSIIETFFTRRLSLFDSMFCNRHILSSSDSRDQSIVNFKQAIISFFHDQLAHSSAFNWNNK